MLLAVIASPASSCRAKQARHRCWIALLARNDAGVRDQMEVTMKKWFILGLFFLATNVYANQLFNPPDKSFVTWLEKGMQENHIPGVSIVVVQNYQIKWAQGFGMADIKNHKPITPHVLFQAASISKPVTAMAALRAVEEGKLSLDQNINTALTSWKIPDNAFTKNKKITLRGLLSHSAGINVPGFVGYASEEKIPTLVEVLNGLPPANSEAIRVTYPIGKKFEYSGGGYTMVQQTLIDRYHKSFPEVMNQLVLNPLQMTSSTFQQPLPAKFTHIALPYRPDGKLLLGGPHTYTALAAAGLWTTPTDLAKYVISIQKSLQGKKGQVLSQSYAELLAVNTQSRAPNTNMALGLVVNLDKEGKPVKHGTYFSHLGQNEGYRNLLIANAKNGNSIIIMTNMSPPEGAPPDQGWKFISAIEMKLAKINQWK